MKKIDIMVSSDTKAFVKRCREYFEYLETLPTNSVIEFWDKQLRMLSAIYADIFALSEMKTRYSSEVDKFVTEKAYNKVKNSLAKFLDETDKFTDLPDMGYAGSTKAVEVTLSETLADIYQELKDFVKLYETGTPENMNDALVECVDTFEQYWGVKLLTALRIIHINLSQTRFAEKKISEQELEIEMEELAFDSEELSNL